MLDIETGIDEIMNGLGFKSFISSNGAKCYTKVLDNGNSLTIGNEEEGYIAVVMNDGAIGKENFFKDLLTCSFKDIDDVVENCMNMNKYEKACK